MDLWTAERQDTARTEAASWAGTPHKNRVCVKGQGVDCLRFVFEVLIVAGVVDRFSLPAYKEALGILRQTNVMEPLILEHCHAGRVEVTAAAVPQFGDVVIFSCGEQSNHTGIVLDNGQVWHVPGRGRCGPDEWVNIRKRLQSLIRFTAAGFTKSPVGLTWEQIVKTKLTPAACPETTS